MVVLHPDTVEWLTLLAAARDHRVLEDREAKTIVRLMGILQGELEAEIDSNIYHKKSCAGTDCECWKTAQGPEVQKPRRYWRDAERIVGRLSK